MSDALPALPHGKRYLTIRQTAQTYPALSEGALRWFKVQRPYERVQSLRFGRGPQTADRRRSVRAVA